MYLLLPPKDVSIEDEHRIAQRLAEVVTLGTGLEKKDSSSSLFRMANEKQQIQESLPGQKVDVKTTLTMPLKNLDQQKLLSQVYSSKEIRIRSFPKQDDTPNDALRKLAVASGQWSRFRVDLNVPINVFVGVFEGWLKNSINRSLADEVFTAQDIATGEDIGFITLKKKGDVVSIGLLAVSENHRRKGIASMLLSRGALWAMEQGSFNSNIIYSVVTQGANEAALKCYRSFGFLITTIQDVYHAWLPQHLEEPGLRADQSALPYCKQYLCGKEKSYVNQVLEGGLDSASRFTVMCSTKIKQMMGPDCDRVVMVPSGTAALEMAALLANLGDGDEVIMPSYTFSSTANAFVLRGAVPVFIDCKSDTINMDELLIEPAITPKTKAICVVHYGGVPCEMDTIMAIAKKHGLLVIEDAAQAFMSTYKGRPVGSIGDFGCFSFHYTKNVICGEGGAICVNRSIDFSRRSLVLWEKGTNRYDFMIGKIDKYEWIDIGSSYVPNEVSCAILWAQLEVCDEIHVRRRANYQMYMHGLADLAAKGIIEIPVIPNDVEGNAHIFFIICPSPEKKLFFEKGLKSKGISAFSHYVPLHSAPAGLKFCKSASKMDVTDYVYRGLLRLPMWIGLTQQDIEHVIKVMHDIADSNP